MQTIFRSFFTVSFYTILSRILGFIRDILIARFLGSTVTSDAFFVAFRIPNFFRRVLAEGAYSAALIPVFSGIVIDAKDDHEAADFVENTMSLLLLVTFLLTIIFFFGMPYIIQILAPGFSTNSESFDLAVYYGKIIFPYLIFISLAAHFTSILNVHEKFAAGAFAPAILNISFILSLFIITPYVSSAGHALSIGVLIGGVGQFLFLYRSVLHFYKPKIKLPELNYKIRKFFKLFFPGVIGSGVIQLNIIIGTVIASFLPIGAISHLYYADRLNQLPLAIFGIALGVVLLPSLSKSIKSNDNEVTTKLQNKSLEFALFNEKDSLAVNRFGIQEPENSKTIELDELDIIFLPCVCFDSKGNRIGMGQGFYDETLNKLTANKETQLIVLAYDFQEVESCMPEAHDIKADACLTPNKFLEFKD